MADVLDPAAFGRVLCSPLLRARQTCELAGFGDRAETCDDLREWDYGEYEGLTSREIWAQRPDWLLWRDGCPGGETPAEVAARADRVLQLLTDQASDSDAAPAAIAFAHGHILRVLAARWVEMEATAGRRLVLSAGRLGVLDHEHDARVVSGWNVCEL